VRVVPLLALLALLAAGCGARSSTPFTAKGTVACIRDKGFTGVTIRPSQVGVIASFAANGGLKATSPTRNVVTVAFTRDATAVTSTQEAFRLHAPPFLRPHINDVMRVDGNAVIVWTTTPASDDEQAVEGCLAS
jgi:hypothetical protein